MRLLALHINHLSEVLNLKSVRTYLDYVFQSHNLVNESFQEVNQHLLIFMILDILHMNYFNYLLFQLPVEEAPHNRHDHITTKINIIVKQDL